MAFCEYFDIDLPKALREQLVAAFEAIETGTLSTENLGTVPIERGVYQLFHCRELVYVGKADKLRSRLLQHRSKIAGRSNLKLEDMQFKCLWMSKNWITLAPEAQLIAEYKSRNLAIWNGNGFGPHDPGAGREDRNKPPALFDSLYPIREAWPCESIEPGTRSARDILKKMKETLPYLLRFQDSPDLDATNVAVQNAGLGASDLLREITRMLPEGWQATRFASHMILYKKLRQFQYGTVIYP